MKVIRAIARRVLRTLLNIVSRDVGNDALRRSAVVFSPHFDDESLGCGGTIIKKVRAGANVHVVFLTDGSKSHRDFVSEAELAAMRRREGLAAAQVLGLKVDDVTCLDFEETRLTESFAEARSAVTRVLRDLQPAEVFVPYFRDPPADHQATNEIMHASIEELGQAVTVYEYPIWFWQSWPWTPARRPARQPRGRQMRNAVRSLFHLFRDCRVRVRIGDVVAEKRAALAKHQSQMTRRDSVPDWPILADVADGEFLDCFLQNDERFCCRQIHAKAARDLQHLIREPKPSDSTNQHLKTSSTT